MVVERERRQAAAWEREMDPARGKRPRKWKKDVILTERTRRSSAKKGVGLVRLHRTNWFLSAKCAKKLNK
jgi:hypothetical protein